MYNPPQFPVIIGVTGHRDIAAAAEAPIRASIAALLTCWRREFGQALAAGGLALSGDSTRESVTSAALDLVMEQLAAAEHDGWMAHRAQAGWSWASTRDDAAKHHPSMRPYAELPEPEKEKDRNNIRHYPDFAARAGYRIVRAGQSVIGSG